MATEQFRDCYIGDKGFEALKKLMKSGNELSTDVAKCFQDRSDAELLYVRALRKSSETLDRLAGRTKGTLALALKKLSDHTNLESEAHGDIGTVLSSDIAIPMKNLAEAQTKERKGIEEAINAKLREWNAQKDIDFKYRARQFERTNEIELLHLKTASLPKTAKNSIKDSAKESILSTPLVVGCVMSRGRQMSASEKISASIQKAEEDLVKTEIKYHNSTKNVELARQACAAEMRRACDQFQNIELNRISETAKFFQTFSASIEALSQTMSQISMEFKNTKIVPENDIVVQARSNPQPAEIEILLYDIYAENVGGSSPMSDLSRLQSLQKWIEMLKKDIQSQPRSYNTASKKIAKKKTPNGGGDDDGGDSSSDGAMCSKSSRSKKDIRRQDGSSSSSNDDDGAMCHKKETKRELKVGTQTISSDTFVDRQSADFLEQLYKASLFNMETVYNRLKSLPEPRYEYDQCLAKTINDKGNPTTFLRLPVPSASTRTPPSAPSIVKHFAETMPLLARPQRQQSPPKPGWVVSEGPREHFASGNRMVTSPLTSAPPYPPAMSSSTRMLQQKKDRVVRVIHPYEAQHEDELTIVPDDPIVLLETRDDGWCKGILNNRTGLFPGNHVEYLPF